MRDVVILGSTGSIGTQALSVIEAHPGTFRVRALAAQGSNLELLMRQALTTGAEVIALYRGDEKQISARLHDLQRTFGVVRPLPQVKCGPKAIAQLAGSYPQAIILNAITGGVGLSSTLAALKSGAQLALANKESLVVGGALVREAMVRPGQIFPVDSEHSAIAQALQSGQHERGLCASVVSGKSELSKLVLTASGGPFRGRKRSELSNVTAKQALTHPTWNMGPMVTINSATLVNKGLELIEAAWLFDVPGRDIVTVVHPQSIVHSLVTWKDGSTVAQASPPNMRIPIALGLSWPERLEDVSSACSWEKSLAWTFEPVDQATFPAIGLARQALEASDAHPAVYNAANEVLVEAFLEGDLAFLCISDLLEKVLQEYPGVDNPDLEQIMCAQKWGAAKAKMLVMEL